MVVVHTLRLWACDHEIQLSAMNEYMDLDFELFSSLDYLIDMAPQMVDDGGLSVSSMAAIRRLYDYVQAPSIPEHDGVAQSYALTIESNQARILARKALEELEEPLGPPDPDYF